MAKNSPAGRPNPQPVDLHPEDRAGGRQYTEPHVIKTTRVTRKVETNTGYGSNMTGGKDGIRASAPTPGASNMTLQNYRRNI